MNTSLAPVEVENIPDEMREANRWIVWRYETVDGRENQKVPRRPRDGRKASSTDPSGWTDFASAFDAYELGDFSGLGFVLGDEWSGVDLDDCLNDSRSFTWGADIVAAFASYTEVSPSLTGVKIFIRGKKPEDAGCSKRGFGPDGIGKLEVYDSGRYFAVTGQILEGKPTEVTDCTQELSEICKQHLMAAPEKVPQMSAEAKQPPVTSSSSSSSDRDVICRKALAACLMMKMKDGNDGSRRLFAAACRAVRFDLTDAEAIKVVREYDRIQKFPSTWTDAQIVKRVRDAEKKQGRGKQAHLILEPSNPMPTAKLYLELFHNHPDRQALLESLDTFYRFNGHCYEEIRHPEIRSHLYEWLEGAKRIKVTKDSEEILPFAPKRNSVGDIMEALRAKCFTSREAPAWLDGSTEPEPRQLIIAKNGIVHLQPTGDPVIIGQPSPRLFALNAIDFNYVNPAPQPLRWLAFLHQLLPNDPQSIQTLQMFFGYFLVADTRQQKALMLVGPKRSGKGTICRILTRLLGVNAVCGPTLSGLATNFGMWPLIGKMLAIISDARLSGKADQSIIVERLLALTGEDGITIDRKNLEPLTLRLFCRLMLVSNELPKLNDASGALASRFVILQLTRSFYGCEDIELENKLVQEMPGILAWAIAGWQKLEKAGRFVIPQSSVDAVAEMEDLASPVKAFIRDFCKLESSAEIAVDDLYNAYCCWCDSEGRAASSKGVFGRDLHAAAQIHCANRRQEVGRKRMYDGIRLSAGAELEVNIWVTNRNNKKNGVKP